MKVGKSLRTCWYFLLALFLTSGLHAQTNTGRILGSVKDQSGGAVGAAAVTVTEADRGVSRSTVTDASGEFVVSNLPPGNYKVRVEAKGFKVSERTSIQLEVNKDLSLDFELSPGSVTDVVTVTEEAPLLDTTNNTLGGTLSNKEINDLPLNGRDFQNLVTLRPGVQRYPGGGFLSISSNGNRPEDNNFVVDGMDGNDPYYAGTIINAEGVQGTPASHLPIDAIQEFNAEENPPAEYGWKPGAIVNVGLKSGTDEYHGTVYYFGRNSALDARNFFNTAPAPAKPLSLNQFGATIGAPIIKDKLFYFLAYEGVRAQVGNSGVLQTPVTSPLGGDASNSIPDAIAALQAQGIGVNALSAKTWSASSGSTVRSWPIMPPTSALTETSKVNCARFSRRPSRIGRVAVSLTRTRALCRSPSPSRRGRPTARAGHVRRSLRGRSRRSWRVRRARTSQLRAHRARSRRRSRRARRSSRPARARSRTRSPAGRRSPVRRSCSVRSC